MNSAKRNTLLIFNDDVSNFLLMKSRLSIQNHNYLTPLRQDNRQFNQIECNIIEKIYRFRQISIDFNKRNIWQKEFKTIPVPNKRVYSSIMHPRVNFYKYSEKVFTTLKTKQNHQFSQFRLTFILANVANVIFHFLDLGYVGNRSFKQ